jgi:CPA1 family monovalent cation:H+ antiporter
MSEYQILCALAAVAFVIAFLSEKLVHLQTTIAITSGALMISLVLLVLGNTFFPELRAFAFAFLGGIDFQQFVLEGVLGFLLFAGGLGINLQAMRSQKWEITVLVLLGVVVSTLLVAAGVWVLCELAGMPIAFIYCLLFGALISPTDPIAVLAIVKKLDAPEQVAIQLEGESLFNDGVGLVVFLSIYAVAFGGEEPSLANVGGIFLHEAVGGIAFGALVGVIAHFMISATDEGPMELAMTLCIPTAGFAFANTLGVSGALAMVLAGIIVGNWTRHSGFSVQSKTFLDQFWLLVDEFLNALLFLMIGLAMLVIEFKPQEYVICACAIPIVLLARFISIRLPYLVFQRYRTYNKYSVRILTWGGLRGALSLAMALSVPTGVTIAGEGSLQLRNVLVAMTYCIVLFSIIIQGSTIAPIINKAKCTEKPGPHANDEPSVPTQTPIEGHR